MLGLGLGGHRRQVIVPPVSDDPATPRPAATVLLLRRGGRHVQRRVEVLMVKRSISASFMPGVWVFPGGAIEPGESPAQCAARELLEEAGIDLGEDPELIGWSRWVTPEVAPVRFDTVFLVGLAPPHSPPRPDRAEVSEAGWFEPRAALDAHAAGDLELVFPTIKTLEGLDSHASADEVIAAARERAVAPILPRVIGTRSNHRIVLPGEDGYEE
ncbi:MAG: NUDIX domain-containing protein [Solirubrobacterales bacterium]|nr:NUDIX domain-containing protein [Solirubrobacterales bacterium]